MNKISFGIFTLLIGIFLIWYNYPTKKVKSNDPVKFNAFNDALSSFQGILELYSERHFNLKIAKATCVYPTEAYTTVIAESGWNHNKAELALKVNNYTGMMVPRTRYYSCVLKDTSDIKKYLGLDFKKDYNVLTVNNVPQKNMKGDTLVAYRNKWAIFLSPVHCALDLGEYQRLNISPEQASTPLKYLTRLMTLGYVSRYDFNNGYRDYWLDIYKKIENGKTP